MKVLSAEFVTSAALGRADAGIPRDGLPEIAMAGRSNVGKSTLINALGRRKVARTSAAPGKTRLANFYRLTLDGGPGRWSFYLVDLPGYGYARGGADAAVELSAVAETYFANRSSRSAVQGPQFADRDSGSALRESERDEPAGRSLQTPAPRRRKSPDPAATHSELRTANSGMALLLVDSRHPELESDRQAARWLESMNVGFRLVATKIDKLSRSERARNLKALENSFGMPPLAVSAASGEGLDALWKTIVSLVRTGRA